MFITLGIHIFITLLCYAHTADGDKETPSLHDYVGLGVFPYLLRLAGGLGGGETPPKFHARQAQRIEREQAEQSLRKV